MNQLLYREAFARYQATPVKRSSLSALAQDGALVISCWNFGVTSHGDAMQYRDSFSQWEEGNAPAGALLREHLNAAVRDNLAVRLIVAHPATKGTRVAKYFHVRPDVVGRVVSFDGDEFVLEFVRQTDQ
jgi:hypothetical protein